MTMHAPIINIYIEILQERIKLYPLLVISIITSMTIENRAL